MHGIQQITFPVAVIRICSFKKEKASVHHLVTHCEKSMQKTENFLETPPAPPPPILRMHVFALLQNNISVSTLF